MKIPKETLGLAAEFATASELCRRGVYAQLTLGLRKRTDLLVETGTGIMLRVQVKGKQADVWPRCQGIYGDGIVLVFVDFEKKAETERPDFYILTPADWGQLVEKELKLTGKVARGEVTIDERNMPTGKDGYAGILIRPRMIEEHLERWEKIVSAAVVAGLA